MKWVPIIGHARAAGFIFFEVYLNEANNQALGWIARTGPSQPYQIYRLGRPTGEGLIETTRGSYKTAQAAVETAIASAGITIGIYPVRLPDLTVQIMKKEAL